MKAAVADAVFVNGPVVENTIVHPVANFSGEEFHENPAYPFVPLESTGIHQIGVTAPSAGADVASKSNIHPEAAPMLAIKATRAPAPVLRRWLDSSADEETAETATRV